MLESNKRRRSNIHILSSTHVSSKMARGEHCGRYGAIAICIALADNQHSKGTGKNSGRFSCVVSRSARRGVDNDQGEELPRVSKIPDEVVGSDVQGW